MEFSLKLPFLNGDQGEGRPRLGTRSQLLADNLRGRYAEQTKGGRVFFQTTTPLGLAIPIYTGTAPRVALWNPLGSNVDVELISISAQRASGTTVEFAAGLMRVLNAGANVATGAVFTVFADDVPYSGQIGGTGASKVRSTASGTVTTTAGVAADFFYSLFHSYAGVGTSTGDGTAWNHEFNGKVIVPPGTGIYLAASVASVALYATTLAWAEHDR